MRRVVVTGMGTVNPLGNDLETTWQAMKDGKLGINETSQEIQEEAGVKFVANVKNFDAKEHFDRKSLRSLDLVSQYAVVASREAAKMANLEDIEDRFRIGCNLTSGIGGFDSMHEGIFVGHEKGYNRMSPLFIPKVLINLVPGNVAIDLELKGICNSVVTACASSTDAIGHAMNYIQSGMVDVMLTGGSEAGCSKVPLAAFNNMKALSKAEEIEKASIPFDEERSGFVMGEGAAVLVLEELEHALKRGAKIYGEVVGYGASCDASHITAPDATGIPAQSAVRMALHTANIDGKEINMVNAHGTSTPLNDKSESALFKATLSSDVKVTSSKSMTGHLLGGAGAIEAINVVKSLEEGVVTPTINTKNLDPECHENVVLDQAINEDMTYALSTSLGFGGHNAAVVFKKYEE
jgi:3-oxoacyl-[acyl-carrier-protein] synthase II